MPVGAKLSMVLLAAVVAGGGAPAPAVSAAPVAPVAGAASEFLGAVTLVTGDHVTVRRVGAQLVPQVRPAAGREHVHFATTAVDDSLLVVPGDAWAAVRTGQVDRRLFDVAALLRDGYGDAGRADIPLIVQGGQAGADATVTARLSTVDAVAVSQPKDTAAGFWAAHRGRIWLDGLRHPSLDVSVPQIGAPAAWDAGFTGSGVPVAVLDTGIDDTHPDLRRQITATKNFTSGHGVRDTDGHGTHVASTIAGTGAASGGKYKGVAPGAKLLVGKVCGGAGCPESAILAGMEWAVGQGAKVVNLSLGGPDTAADDPLELAVERLSAEHGTLFVVAAGNDGGYGAETVSSPASADAALAVGAVDDQDALASFSGRGPRVHDAALKPEITAPGVEITAARSRYSTRGKRGDRYVAISGTSMATPHVSGSAAILAQRHPEWTGARLKAALVGAAEPGAEGVYEQGAGRVDVARAVGQDVVAEPATVSVGRMSWPHADDEAVTRTITYHNDGDEPRTLRLALSSGTPEGMFGLSASSVTVPPHGTAGVAVTVDTAVPAAEGTFGTWVSASDETGGRVVTPVAVDREPESYDLTLETLDAKGAPTDAHYSFVFGLDESRFRPVPGIGDAGTLRVRAGRYHVDGAISTPRPGGTLFDSAKVVHPTVEVRADTTVVLDARSARPVSVTFDRANVVPKAVAVAYTRFTPRSSLNTGVLGDTFDRIGVGQVGARVPEEEMITSLGGVWAVPDAQGDVLRSAVTYNLSWFGYGDVPTGFTRHVVDGELARVHAVYRAQADRKRGTKVWVAQEPRAQVSNGFGFGFRLPLERTEFHNVTDVTDGAGVRWSGELQQWAMVNKQVHTETVLTGGVVDHQPGTVTEEEWNTAVFGPGFTTDGEFATRSGDVVAFNLPLYGDAGLDRAGVSEVDAGSTALYREGVLVGETAQPGLGQFEVPAAASSYRLEVSSRRSDVSEFSTLVSCVWTFTSARPPDEDPKPKGKGGVGLPLLAVRFAPPDLDRRNSTAADEVRVPVTVQRPYNAPPAGLASLTVDASFDDGRTWRPVPVTLDGADGGTVEITHPRSARFVSLRAHAADSAGNTVTQTVIRAYGSR
ncbi:S8 family peptidase [Actinophytocola algeriensis]|uniref:Subtilisin family serine protease n=1 Tax=Actinophytocola algeriensis TaxID=1768010 RepID=A0A7W7QCZ8_9PSEU|nr:S8 family serine peptidase [Actinophytocola algeriensis]MBB4910841.1 subtilisin family serine protease [Actinophytocola algeriensis]MBE1473834.1 subtilisin family serine protease [Actinophytocola algeriensis]